MKRPLLVSTFGLAVLLCMARSALAIAIFAEGMITPETISRAPLTFGAYGGSYFIPDAAGNSSDLNLHNVWVVRANGDSTTVFSTGNQEVLLGGLFLPDTDSWNVNRGKYLTTGRYPDFAENSTGLVYTYDPLGSRELIASVAGARFSQAAIAPEGFGTIGGNLIVSESFSFTGAPGRVFTIAPNGNSAVLAQDLPATSPFGLAFAPAGFGAVGGELLVGDSRTGTIAAVASDGSSASFSTVALAPGQSGLRQMAFSPAGFIPGLGELLFVSVSGSVGGGGMLGDVLALDQHGNLIVSLRSDLGLDKFDPRGLLFTEDGNLLISDASDPVWLATAQDFRRVPLPGSLALFAIALAALFGAWKQKR